MSRDWTPVHLQCLHQDSNLDAVLRRDVCDPLHHEDKSTSSYATTFSTILITMRYTKEVLDPVVSSSFTISEVMRKLGANPVGGSHTHVSRMIKKFGLDTSHFLGSRFSSFGKNQKPIITKRHWTELLRLGTAPVCSTRLRRALIESGRPYRCAECGGPPVWNGKPLTLHVEHKNANRLDNTPENLLFLCPNCHTQTPSYGKRKIDQ